LTVDTKTCTKCLERKALNEFGSKGRTSDGRQLRQSQCNQCRRPLRRKIANAWLERNPGYRMHYYYNGGKERCKESAQSYYESNKERHAKWNRDWVAKNSVRRLELNAQYRARRVGVIRTPYSRTEIFARWGGRCCYCDEPATALDHVTPIVRGGADAAFNLVPACTSCNSSKGAKSLAEWALTFRPKVES
jgi:5-methylcytosine-specific restriction endonuclease McrA